MQERTLESMLPVSNPSRSDGDELSGKAIRFGDIKESRCELISIAGLRQSVVKNIHHGLYHCQI